MNAFDVKIENAGIAGIYDCRYEGGIDITDGTGRFGWLTYTRSSDDLATAEKPEFLPYTARYAGFTAVTETADGWELTNPAFDLSLSVSPQPDRLVLRQRGGGNGVSACGVFLPLNFMSDKNGESEHQFLISSPYHTADRQHWLHYFTRPDGRHLVVIAEQPIDGYRVCYSPFLCGHFIRGIEFLRSFDRVYGLPEREGGDLTLHLLPVSSYREALEKAGEIWGIPALYYDTASVRIGEPFVFEPIGEVGAIRVTAPSGAETLVTDRTFVPAEYGIHTAVPADGGADCAFFAWDDRDAMFRRSCDALPMDKGDVLGTALDGTPIWRPPYLYYRGYYDYNLCEHGMWCWALLRYMRRHGVQEPYDSMVKNFLRIVLEDGIGIERCTLSASQGWRTLDSSRIQEAYGGINILLDAWLVYGDRRYLETAVTALNARLDYDLGEDDGLYRRGSDGATAAVADYTTVTCLVLPVVSLTLELEKQHDPRAARFRDAAERIADFVVARGRSFPTEGGEHPEVNPEVEEGSISCSALTVLYVYEHLVQKDAYLQFAKEVLDLHDAYSVYTPHPVMYRSSLRWWETVWEGDADGPAVCFGHAWSLWRAEAQYWYGRLAHDDARLYDSYQGFMGNYAKAAPDGTTYSIYQYEALSGGAVTTDGREMRYELREGFPDTADVTLSRYLFARDFECWQQTLAVLTVNGRERILGGRRQDGVLIPDVYLQTLVFGDVHGRFEIATAVKPRIVSAHPYRVEKTADRLIVTVE